MRNYSLRWQHTATEQRHSSLPAQPSPRVVHPRRPRRCARSRCGGGGGAQLQKEDHVPMVQEQSREPVRIGDQIPSGVPREGTRSWAPFCSTNDTRTSVISSTATVGPDARYLCP